ncbi:hypothetical protein EDC04DRAFT_2613669 [Pisolithus marmoratus]|nr:hypothetical protein EDC04DRAFT_2613669 [Pisolithus marmoratus]
MEFFLTLDVNTPHVHLAGFVKGKENFPSRLLRQRRWSEDTDETVDVVAVPSPATRTSTVDPETTEQSPFLLLWPSVYESLAYRLHKFLQDIPRAPEECVASGVEAVMGKRSRLANGSTSALCDSSMIYPGCPQPECLDGNPRPATSFIRCRSRVSIGRHLMGEDEDLEILRKAWEWDTETRIAERTANSPRGLSLPSYKRGSGTARLLQPYRRTVYFFSRPANPDSSQRLRSEHALPECVKLMYLVATLQPYALLAVA